jgi:hypothetical protein
MLLARRATLDVHSQSWTLSLMKPVARFALKCQAVTNATCAFTSAVGACESAMARGDEWIARLQGLDELRCHELLQGETAARHAAPCGTASQARRRNSPLQTLAEAKKTKRPGCQSIPGREAEKRPFSAHHGDGTFSMCATLHGRGARQELRTDVRQLHLLRHCDERHGPPIGVDRTLLSAVGDSHQSCPNDKDTIIKAQVPATRFASTRRWSYFFCFRGATLLLERRQRSLPSSGPERACGSPGPLAGDCARCDGLTAGAEGTSTSPSRSSKRVRARWGCRR